MTYEPAELDSARSQRTDSLVTQGSTPTQPPQDTEIASDPTQTGAGSGFAGEDASPLQERLRMAGLSSRQIQQLSEQKFDHAAVLAAVKDSMTQQGMSEQEAEDQAERVASEIAQLRTAQESAWGSDPAQNQPEPEVQEEPEFEQQPRQD